MTSAIAISSVRSTSAARRGWSWCGPRDQLDRRRDRRLQLRQQRLHAVDRVDDVGAGLPEQTMTSTAGLPLAKPGVAQSSTESVTSATSDSRTGAPLR
jgi:hypothetical protein